MSMTIAAFLRPFMTLLMIWLICWPVKRLFVRYVPESRFKRFLLQPIGKRGGSSWQ